MSFGIILWNQNMERNQSWWQWWKQKAKMYKKCVLKGKLNFEDSKICLEAIQLENKINQLEKLNLM